MTATPPSPGVSRRLPAWLRGVLIAVALLVVVALIVPYFLDVNHYRALVSAAVKKQTGRELTLGKIRAKFLPTVGFVVDDAHLGNPPGFPQGDFLRSEERRVGKECRSPWSQFHSREKLVSDQCTDGR